MLYCNLQVLGLLCTEIAVQEHFALPKYDFWRDFRGGAKKFSRLGITRHILRPLINYGIIRPLPRPPSRLEGCPLHIPHPSRRLWHLDPGALGPRAWSPTFQTKVTPLAGPQASHQLNH